LYSLFIPFAGEEKQTIVDLHFYGGYHKLPLAHGVKSINQRAGPSVESPQDAFKNAERNTLRDVEKEGRVIIDGLAGTDRTGTCQNGQE